MKRKDKPLDKAFMLRLTTEEKENLEKLALETGCPSVTSYIKNAIFRKRPLENADDIGQTLKDIRGLVKKILELIAKETKNE
jgi:predicted DNA-binding protein